MMNRHVVWVLTAILWLLAAPIAQAHSLASEGTTMIAGFTHTLFGWDHLLALFAVGFLASRQQKAFRWHLPISFLIMLVLGTFIAIAGIPLPFVEEAIAGSLLVLGLLIAFPATRSNATGMALVSLFALFHGHAHGTEIPQLVSAHLYALGFVLAAIALQGVGFGAGRLWRPETTDYRIRLGGITIGAAGIMMWF